MPATTLQGLRADWANRVAELASRRSEAAAELAELREAERNLWASAQANGGLTVRHIARIAGYSSGEIQRSITWARL